MSELERARITAHWAAQIPGAVAAANVEKAADWSHTALSFVEGWLMSAPADRGNFRVGLELSSLDVGIFVDGIELWRMPLVGCTFDEALGAVDDELHERFSVRDGSKRPTHDLPPHPVQDGAPFEEPDALVELAGLYETAAKILEIHRARDPRSSPVRCWPHHFDIAVLTPLDPDADPEEARSIGVGMSPGDGTYALPYWYVSPWPKPAIESLPPLKGLGHWHTEGFVSAVLTHDEVAASANREATISTFVREATAVAREVIGAG